MSTSRVRRVCIVTNELFPFTAGGIGRLTHNLIKDSLRRKVPVELHLLVPCWSDLDEHTVVAYFGGRVEFHKACSLDSDEHKKRWGATYPPRWAFTDSVAHADSLELMLELKHLEAGGHAFDVVEFPDFLGWGFCTLQERKLGLAFGSTQVAVRLHSTDGMLQAVENQPPTLPRLGLLELERRALEEADLVVGHLDAVADENQRFYGFDDAWRRRVVIEFPPITELTVEHDPDVASAAPPDLLFVTKVQRFKRPDLFVRGVAAFMTTHPGYTGRAIFACHAPSEEYASAIRLLVPKALAGRFSFIGPQAREALMRRAIVIIPSDYESLNLTAYEAADLGATIVLNEKCSAFGAQTPFIDGENCHKFDGSVEGLSSAIERAVRVRLTGKVVRQTATPYFERPAEVWRPRPSSVGRGKVSVLITNYNLAAYLPQAIESIAASTYDNVELVIVDDASTHPLDAEMLRALEAGSADLPVKVVRNIVNRGLPASRNVGLAHCTGDYVLPLDADDRIAPRFIEVAVRALEGSPEHSVVVPTTGYFLSDDAADDREFIDFACFLGNAPTLGMVANRFSTATSLMRRSLFERFHYDEELDSYEDWSLYLRMAHAGVRFLVTNDIGFHYRRRERSMVRGIDAARHQRLLSRIYATLPSPPSPALLLRYLPLLMEPGRAATAPGPEPKRALRYRFADHANSLVKRTPIHRHIKENLMPLLTTEERPLRYEVADRVNEVVQRLAIARAWFTRASR